MNEKLLKSIVIGLGVLIILALGFLIYKIATDATTQIAATTNDKQPYEIITQPPDKHFIVDKDIQGNTLIITYENIDDGFIWHLYDINDGRFIGSVRNP